MRTNHMHIQPEHPVIGMILTVLLAVGSMLLNLFSFVHDVDKTMLEPLLHLVQIAASVMALIVGFATIYPPFKEALIDIIDSFKKH